MKKCVSVYISLYMELFQFHLQGAVLCFCTAGDLYHSLAAMKQQRMGFVWSRERVADLKEKKTKQKNAAMANTVISCDKRSALLNFTFFMT